MFDAFSEILADPVVLEKLSDTKASREVKALDVFYQMLRNDSDKAIYGLEVNLFLLFGVLCGMLRSMLCIACVHIVTCKHVYVVYGEFL